MSNEKNIKIPAGKEFIEAVDNTLKEQSNLVQEVKEPAIPEGVRVIENEEQARELLEELKNEDPKKARLIHQAKIQAQLEQMSQVWKALPRRSKRKFMKPKLKFSNRIKAALRQKEINK